MACGGGGAMPTLNSPVPESPIGSPVTGEVWAGSVMGIRDQPACDPPADVFTGELEIVVGDDGTVTGSVTERHGDFSCGGVLTPDSVDTYAITGRKTAEAFELLIGETPMTIPITGTHATVTVSRPVPGGDAAEVTYTADCVTCAP